MKPENLETLLLDRALGHLPPEVADLLDDHLQRNPEARGRADSLTATLCLARQAVAVPLSEPLPAVNPQWMRASTVARWRTIGGETLKLAACVAVGLAAGWMVRTPPSEKSGTIAAAESRSGDLKKNAAASFWSSARVTAEATVATTATEAVVPSPLRWPAAAKPARVEEKL